MRSILLVSFLLLPIAVAPGDPPQELLHPPAERISSSYFGMHIHQAAQPDHWPTVNFQSWRLWDAGVAWPQLEPRRGEWRFNLLDKYVELARLHHVEILLTLGLTPGWAALRPGEPSNYEPGNAAEPREMEDWRSYVRTIAIRYKGQIHQYEIWNEPSDRKSFSGDAATLAEMTRVAAETLKQVDPSITIVSASANAQHGLQWLDQYLAAGAGKYIDVIAYHFYVFPDPPEKMVGLIQSTRAILQKHGLANRPLWNTESGWAKPKLFPSDSEAAAYVSRAYILNWAASVSRFYWYAWDNHGWVTLQMTDRQTQQPTAAASAYATTEDWLLGEVMPSCGPHESGVWICELTKGSSRSWILWSPDRTTRFSLPRNWDPNYVSTLSGTTTPLKESSIEIGATPILLRE